MPTLMGYDPDHELSSGEVGVCGVNVASLQDMEILFDGIDLEKISVSQTINGPAIILFAFYVALAKKNGIDVSKLRGTLQNDALKEYGSKVDFPPEPSVKLVVDIIEYFPKTCHYTILCPLVDIISRSWIYLCARAYFYTQ